MEKIPNIHPGEILWEDFLKPMNITAYLLAKETRIDQTRISEIIKGKAGQGDRLENTKLNKKFLPGGPGGAVFTKRVPPGRRRQRGR